MLTIKGKVLQVQVTKSGEWARVFVSSGRAFNHVLMVPAAGAPAEGDPVEMDVRAQVDTDRDGHPQKSITYWAS